MSTTGPDDGEVHDGGRCGSAGAGRASAGAACVRGRVVWFREAWCTVCSYKFAEDGHAPLPDDIRATVLARDGEWSVFATDGSAFVPLAQALKGLGWTHSQVVALKRAVFPVVLLNGTRPEAQCLADALTEAGLSVTVRRSEYDREGRK